MALIVQKFGGTSVADTHLIKKIAKLILSEINNNNKIVIVISAMAGVTNHLVSLCSDISKLDDDSKMAEYDSALCTGEIVTSALLALALQELGLKSRSILAYNLPILCNSNYGNAFVESLDNKLIIDCLDKNIIPVIAGFQGITQNGRFITIGRGGSDTSATLVAGSIKADFCDIYSDVEGIFTSDPRIVHNAQKISEISFEEMLELASSGAKILHPRSVEIGMRYNIPIRVFSSFSKEEGTLISKRRMKMENRIVTGITSNKNLLKVSIEDSKLDFIEICNLLAQNNINIELILNEKLAYKHNFITNLSDKKKLETILREARIDSIFDDKIATISIVGYGIKNNPDLIGKIVSLLKDNFIEIMMVQISEIKIMLLIADINTEKAVKLLHEYFFKR